MTKNNTTLIGAQAEGRVVVYLKKKKYLVLERNFKTKYGEIDIIVRKDNCIKFVEVKKRNYVPDEIEEIIPFKKRNSLINAAKAFITKNNYDEDSIIFEFDLAVIDDNDNVKYFENFFEI